MPHSGSIQRLGAVVAEFEASRHALARLQSAAAANPTALGTTVSHVAVRQAISNLEGVYFLRLFAVFESVVRDLWGTKKRNPSKSPPPMKALLESLASTCKVTFDALAEAQEVREDRNEVAHHARGPIRTIGDSRSRLAKFLGQLPDRLR